MILRAGLVFAATLMWGGLTSAQSPTPLAPVDDRSIAYFLVDASGSMGKNGKNQALPVLEKMLDELPAGSMHSVTFFGGRESVTSPPYGCNEEINVQEAEPKGEPLDHTPMLGGDKDFTAIGKALESFFEQVGDDATVTILSDGIEQCGADFAAIRNKYASATINFVPVPVGVRHPLELLNIKPQSTRELEHEVLRAVPLATVTANITFNDVRQTQASSGAWNNADWHEKYLWLFGYICLTACVVSAAGRFDAMSTKIESYITNFENYRRRKAQKDERESESESDLPDSLEIDTIKHESPLLGFLPTIFLLLAALILVPLAFADGAKQLVAVAWGTLLAIGPLALHIAIPWFKKWRWFSVDGSGVQFLRFPKGAWPKFGVFVFLLSMGSVLGFFVNLEEARQAAWFVLGSNFSAAIAIIASAPWLFLGARWWSFKRTEFTYHAVEGETISAAIREKRVAQRMQKLDFENFQSRISRWSFPIPLLDPRRWTQIGLMRFQRNRAAAIQKLRLIALAKGKELPRSDANDLYRELLSAENLEDAIQLLLDRNLIVEQVSSWEELAKALKSANERRIGEAYAALVKGN